jgi:hypothetical protein
VEINNEVMRKKKSSDSLANDRSCNKLDKKSSDIDESRNASKNKNASSTMKVIKSITTNFEETNVKKYLSNGPAAKHTLQKNFSQKELIGYTRRGTVSNFSSNNNNTLTILSLEKKLRNEMELKRAEDEKPVLKLKKNFSFCEKKLENPLDENKEKVVIKKKDLLRNYSVQKFNLDSKPDFLDLKGSPQNISKLNEDISIQSAHISESTEIKEEAKFIHVFNKKEKSEEINEKLMEYNNNSISPKVIINDNYKIVVSTFSEECGERAMETLTNHLSSEEKSKTIEEKPTCCEPLKERNLQESLNMLAYTKVFDTSSADENKKIIQTAVNNDPKRNRSPNAKLETIAENFESEDAATIQSAHKEKKFAEDFEKKITEEFENKITEEIEKKIAAEIEKRIAAEIQKKIAEEYQKKKAVEIRKKTAAEIQKKTATEIRLEIQQKTSVDIEKRNAGEIEQKTPSEIQQKTSVEIEKKDAVEFEKKFAVVELEKKFAVVEIEQTTALKIEQTTALEINKKTTVEIQKNSCVENENKTAIVSEKKSEAEAPDPKPKIRTSKKKLTINGPDSESKANLIKSDDFYSINNYTDSVYATPRLLKIHSNFCENNWFEKGSSTVFDFREDCMNKDNIKIVPLEITDWVLDKVDSKIWEIVLDYAGFSAMLNFRLVSRKGLDIFLDYFDRNLTKTQIIIDRAYVNIKKEWRDCIAVKIVF